jgi:6-phosphofructokinase 2
MSTIVTLTINPTIDTNATVDHVIPERKLRCQPPRHEPGGGGINVSRAIRKLGGDSVAVYPVGGPTGHLLQHLLEQEGLTLRAVPIGDWTRENFVILEEATGQQFHFVMPGPTLQEAEWQQCLNLLSTFSPVPAYIVASGSLPPGVPTDFYARVARIGRKCGARVIVDTSGDAFRAAVYEGVYLLKPNQYELSDLANCDLTDEAQQEAAAVELVHRGHGEAVVLSLGAAGVLLVTAAGCERLRAPTVPVVSKIGAGDSTVAGIVLSLARGMALRDAVLFGIATGAAAVMTPGTELCRREDVERLYTRLRAAAA